MSEDYEKKIQKLIVVSQVLTNKIKWKIKPEFYDEVNNYQVDIKRTIYKKKTGFYENMFNQFSPSTRIPIKYNEQLIGSETYSIIKDFDVSMNENYKYSLNVYKGTSYENSEEGAECYTLSYRSDSIPANISYNYTEKSFNFSWNEIESNYIDPNSSLTYIITYYDKENDILKEFDTNSNNTSYNIISNVTPDTDGGTLNITNGTYNFFITPKIVTTNDDGNKTYTKELIDVSRNLIPTTYVLESPNPENFKISSPYDNSKIEFSWNKPQNIDPDSYELRLTNITKNTTLPIIPISKTETTFTLDNSDIENSSYLPGNYKLELIAKYNNLESKGENFLYFNIPLINISFSITPVDENENPITNNEKDIAGFKLVWNGLGYVKYYRIRVRQFDEMGNEKEELIYHISNILSKKTSVILAWNFPGKKSKFIFKMDYTTDLFPIIETEKALGSSYLGEVGTNYDIYLNINNNESGILEGEFNVQL